MIRPRRFSSRSASATFRPTRLVPLAAVLYLATACIPPRFRMAGASSPRNGITQSDSTRAGITWTVVVRIVNSTVQPYRVALIYGGASHVLGTVLALEATDFPVPRNRFSVARSFS
jgi:hypothetical protein